MHLLMWKIDKKILRGAKNDEFDYLGTKVKCVKKKPCTWLPAGFSFSFGSFKKIWKDLFTTKCNRGHL